MQMNSLKNKCRRQTASLELINNLYQGKTVINIDESIINCTDSRSRSWLPKVSKYMMTNSMKMAQLSIILGTASDGQIYFTLNRGYHNQHTMIIFLKKLIKVLDGKDSNWRSKTVLMLDNAPYHRSKLVS